MLDGTGCLRTQQDEIADVFGDFYTKLYNDSTPFRSPDVQSIGECAPVTTKEVEDALRKLKKDKACGDDELMAEMLKSRHSVLT